MEWEIGIRSNFHFPRVLTRSSAQSKIKFSLAPGAPRRPRLALALEVALLSLFDDEPHLVLKLGDVEILLLSRLEELDLLLQVVDLLELRSLALIHRLLDVFLGLPELRLAGAQLCPEDPVFGLEVGELLLGLREPLLGPPDL